MQGYDRFAKGPRLPREGRIFLALVDLCGRGGTGRRATLRSLWAKARGSSSLLDRTRQSLSDCFKSKNELRDLRIPQFRALSVRTPTAIAVRDVAIVSAVWAISTRSLGAQNCDCNWITGNSSAHQRDGLSSLLTGPSGPIRCRGTGKPASGPELGRLGWIEGSLWARLRC